MNAITALLAERQSLPVRRPQNLGAAQTYRIRAQADVADVYLYADIGGWFGISAEQFIADLRALRGAPLRVHLNSPGGDVFDGLAIYNTLLSYPAPVETIVEGLAASIASIIALAGRPATMARASMLMIHEPWGLTVGTAQDMLDMAATLEKAGDVLADVYSQATGSGPDVVRDWMRAETWWTAAEALEAGLIQRIGDEAPAEAVAARARFDLSAYRNVPRGLQIENAQRICDPAPDPAALALAQQQEWIRNRRTALAGVAA